jgi:hypothetical protein
MLEAGSTLGTFFDGDTVPTVPTYTVAWSGAANESTSVITPTRTEVDITPWIKAEPGVDWGDAEIEAYRAQGQVGESVIDYRLPNRNIVAPLVIKDTGGTAFATIRSYIQAKAATWQREGGAIARITPQGGTLYADIVSDGLTLSGGWMQAHRDADPDAELRLEAIPDFYEAEELIASAEETSAAELITVIPDPGGDMPARVRIVVEEKQGQDQRGLIWAFRSRYYSSASTAKTAYEAEELLVLDAARKVALSGASGGTVVQHGTISTNWTPVVGGRLGGAAFPTNTGTNRFFARLYSTSGTRAQARLVWDVGDLINPVENAAYRLPGASNFYIADLGEVRPDKVPVGPHRWDWQIQAMGDVGNEDFKVDKVWIVNADEGMGVLTAPITSSNPNPGLATYVARDEFNQAAGSATGEVAVVGGTYVAATGSDTTDFVINASTHKLERTATLDSGSFGKGVGRAIGLDLNLSATAARIDLMSTWDEGSQGLIVRFVDASNYFTVFYNSGSIRIFKIVSGTTSEVRRPVPIPYGIEQGISLGVVVIGEVYAVYAGGTGGWPQPVASGVDSSLASPLASGDVYIFDEYIGSHAATRTYDNFKVWVPTPDAVAFASKLAQLTVDGMYRLDSGGSAYGPVSRVVGDLPRLPAGGLENRPTELFLKASRGVIGEFPDSGIDDLGVKVFASRSWLTVPGTI